MPTDADPVSSRPALLVVGGSARFLACSCHRAGWRVHAADRFGDADLMAIAATYRPLSLDFDEPHAPFPDLAGMPFLFSGGLENNPAFLARLAKSRQLAAASPAAVTAVRDLDQLAGAAETVGLRVPETHRTPSGLPTDGSFLIKPRESVGGHGIQLWRGGPAPSGSSLWQRRHAGTPHGVSLLLRSDQTAELLGVCRSLQCDDATAAGRWAYAGSVTVIPPPWVERVLSLAELLARQFGLLGGVGIDCIAEHSGSVLVLEVNPRPTASMELHERTRGFSLAAKHLSAFGIHSLHAGRSQPLAAFSGKAILYAHKPLAVTPAVEALLAECARAWQPREDLTALADIPRSGSRIDRGSPVLTVFADGCSSDLVEALLDQRLRHLRSVCFSQPFVEASSRSQPLPRTASDTHLQCYLDRSSSTPRLP